MTRGPTRKPVPRHADLGTPRWCWGEPGGCSVLENPHERGRHWQQKSRSICQGRRRNWGLVSHGFRKPSGHTVPFPRPACEATHGCLGRPRRSPRRLDTPPCALPLLRGQGDPGHSPAAYVRVNVEQGAPDQVAGRGPEDGRCVEDGWKGSRERGSAGPAPRARGRAAPTPRMSAAPAPHPREAPLKQSVPLECRRCQLFKGFNILPQSQLQAALGPCPLKGPRSRAARRAG